MSEHKPGLSYAAAGVDIDAAHQAMKGVAALVRSTATSDTLSELGSFGGLYRVPRDARQPVLVASTDGVGTKLKVAFTSGRHGTVGEDLVNHCVNDILVQGAKPLFFLDYVGVGKLEPGVVEALVEGVARGCRENGCALLGGETAEMPDMYSPGEYDLAGTIVGLVEEDRLLDGRAIRPGDALIGLASTGLHTNGYSLARRIVFERMGLGMDDAFPEEDGTVADVLLRVHKSYLRSLYPLIEAGRIRGLAHITGGGLTDNVPRILPEGVDARFDLGSWTVPPLFRVLQREGGVERDEMFRAFNMGVGMVAVVAKDDADAVVRDLRAAGEQAWIAGEIVPGEGKVVLSDNGATG
ncbi:phosphoribosylformylglycinamidine cyclo-ligase [Longimicrobium sp.]|uniref:phosphoribosylformylglycinamidine cyclo-ligase n=1 Tax=Longimicrobium sp. TaxID=2029185 RepID=UPI002E302008|nr:phosphoribosylformylglycinamidine cyclo-ligase [Longimicrobium sp.]HEX6038337.1 phosphoribosylformylglycinamidine cyclo-ligase [Longimicrobium sp.]